MKIYTNQIPFRTMRKLILTLLGLLTIVVAHAFDTNMTFGIKQQDSPEGYQQYVGKSFQFRYPAGKLETWEKSGFKPSDEIIPNTYTITKVTVKDVELNKKPNREITVEAVQNGAKKKVKFKAYEEVSVKVGFWGDVKQWPLIGYMPIMFTEPLNEYKAQNVGKTLTHPMVKDTYEVTDAYVARPGGDVATAELGLEVKNNRTGAVKKFFSPSVHQLLSKMPLKGIIQPLLLRLRSPRILLTDTAKQQQLLRAE